MNPIEKIRFRAEEIHGYRPTNCPVDLKKCSACQREIKEIEVALIQVRNEGRREAFEEAAIHLTRIAPSFENKDIARTLAWQAEAIRSLASPKDIKE